MTVALAALVIAWIGYKAFGSGFGANGQVPTFVIVVLNGLTLGGLYFVVASGFTLIFGLMRVVNLAHGAFYLLGGYIAYTLIRHGITGWWGAAAIATTAVGLFGLLIEQALLRWNLGQEIRQSLITIALSIILADQMLANFGGVSESLNAPGGLAVSIRLGFYDLYYPPFRFVALAAAGMVALASWYLIKRTRLGMLVRAGVDDRHMVGALGVNIQLVFGAIFFLGSALAGLGGVVGGTMLVLAPGVDTSILLSSLVVVIVGGLGSLAGAAVAALLLGLIDQLSAVYLPSGYTNFSILLTFAVLAITIAVRPTGFFGRAERRPDEGAQLPVGALARSRDSSLFSRLGSAAVPLGALGVAIVAPLFASTFFTSEVGIKTLWLGIAAVSLIFLVNYAGMLSLAQTAFFGIAAFTAANLSVKAGVGPWWAALAGIASALGVGLLLGALASRAEGIYFLMLTLAFAVITYYFFSQVTSLSGHEGINNVPAPKLLGDPVLHPDRMYYAALGVCVAIYALIRYLVRTPLGLSFQGMRDEPVRMTSLGFNVALHRTMAFAVGSVIAAVAGIFSVWSNTRVSPGSIDITRTIEVLVAAVVGGLYRLEGAWIGALVIILLDTYTRGISDRFETVIGLVFLLVVLGSPGGIVGMLHSSAKWVRSLRVRTSVVAENRP